ncbi:HDOD domain-containing protein [Pleionea sediminis]|uniref:HDOD domain-containing protein n=1 Tax=Pleionea sediminis TaxID=2569479 RepID=UPI001184B702|nr:HDOD domain-containing protein [Pleionea sediminis]
MQSIEQKVELLKQFTAFEYLNVKQLAIVAGQVDVIKVEKGQELFQLGNDDRYDYFLISGILHMVAGDGKSYSLEAGTSDTKRPISTLRPRKYTAEIRATSILLKIQHELLTYIINQHNSTEFGSNLVEFSNSQLTPEMVTSEIKQAILHGELKLPSLPDVAMRIRKFSQTNGDSVEQMVQAIMLDPSISVKVIQCANSPLFRGVNPIRTCTEAVIRLGKDTTIQLVTIFSMRELFNSDNEELKKKFIDIWRKSVDVAVICAVLAKKSKLAFEPEVAMMAGLLHRLGELSIYSFANDYRGFLTLDEVIEHLVKDYKSQVACDIIQQWQLGDVYYQCMKYLEHWDKEQIMSPDYSDLLNVAVLHEYIRTHDYHNLPHFDQLPSFNRIQVGPSTPELSIEALEESEKELKELKAMLTG